MESVYPADRKCLFCNQETLEKCGDKTLCISCNKREYDAYVDMLCAEEYRHRPVKPQPPADRMIYEGQTKFSKTARLEEKLDSLLCLILALMGVTLVSYSTYSGYVGNYDTAIHMAAISVLLVAVALLYYRNTRL